MLNRQLIFVIALVLVVQPTSTVAFQFSAKDKLCLKKNPLMSDDRPKTHVSMGLYEDEDDWDAELFGQIEKSNNNRLLNDGEYGGTRYSKNTAEFDFLDDSEWDMRLSDKGSNAKSMRERMKQSWGVSKDESCGVSKEESWGVSKEESWGVSKEESRGVSKEEGKSTADWMPGYRKGPDEEEPWFTG